MKCLPRISMLSGLYGQIAFKVSIDSAEKSMGMGRF